MWFRMFISKFSFYPSKMRNAFVFISRVKL